MRPVQAAILLAIALRCVEGAVLAQQQEPIKTELQLSVSHYRVGDPIVVDVWLENQTGKDIDRPQYSPFSSSVGLPKFIIRRVPSGWEYSIPPGLYGAGESWGSWYQPDSEKTASIAGNRTLKETVAVGRFVLPAGTRVHLLRGDLRRTILHAREHCQRALEDDRSFNQPDTASTKKHYQDIVRFADDFLKGGIFEISVHAYSRSQVVRITIDPGNLPSGSPR